MPHHSNKQRKRNELGHASSSRKKNIKAERAEERAQAHLDHQVQLKELEREFITEAAEINWLASCNCSQDPNGQV